MEIKELEKKLNIGIPCYNNVFFELQPFTLKCYKKSLGCEAISAERALRQSGVELIRNNTSLHIRDLDDNIFAYLTMGVDIKNSNASFGFNRVSKLKSLLNSDYSQNNTEVEIYSLKRAKNILINNDFSDLEEAYYNYLDQNKVEIEILEKYCLKVYDLLKLNLIDLAQNYLFFLSAYYEKYGNVGLTIDGIRTNLKKFIEKVLMIPGLKEEYILRECFTSNDFRSNLNIIQAIKNKKEIIVNEDLCESSKTKREHNAGGIKRGTNSIITDKGEIERVLNDRRTFYSSQNPIGEVRSDGTFAKYGAFIYENGNIVADRLYDVNTIEGLSQDAIYKFNAENFEERRKMTKSELTAISNSKIYHTGTWKDRIDIYINMETSDELKESAKQLIKK